MIIGCIVDGNDEFSENIADNNAEGDVHATPAIDTTVAIVFSYDTGVVNLAAC